MVAGTAFGSWRSRWSISKDKAESRVGRKLTTRLYNHGARRLHAHFVRRAVEVWLRVAAVVVLEGTQGNEQGDQQCRSDDEHP
jgi:hypothetical protein